jgi:hypothetical protein
MIYDPTVSLENACRSVARACLARACLKESASISTGNDRFSLCHRNSGEGNGEKAMVKKSSLLRISSKLGALARALSVIVPLGNDHGGAVNGITFHRKQSFVGLIERKRSDFGLKIKLGGNAKKIVRIGPGHVGNAAKLAFSP